MLLLHTTFFEQKISKMINAFHHANTSGSQIKTHVQTECETHDLNIDFHLLITASNSYANSYYNGARIKNGK